MYFNVNRQNEIRSPKDSSKWKQQNKISFLSQHIRRRINPVKASDAYSRLEGEED